MKALSASLKTMLGATTALLCGGLLAQEVPPPADNSASPGLVSDWRVNGFYSLTGINRNNDAPQYAYVPYGDQTHGIGAQGLDWDASSKLGLMINGAFTPELGFGVQYLVRQGSDREPRLRTPLAYVEWRPGNWEFKLGRTAPGVALVEDSLHADHGHLWLKPAVEVYAYRPRPQVDGVSLTRHTQWNDWYASFQAAYGVADFHARNHRRHYSAISALSVVVTKDDLLLRAALQKSRMDLMSLPSNADLLRRIRADIPSNYWSDFSDQNIGFLFKSLSVRWTPGPWTVQAEWHRNDIDKPYLAPYWGSYLLLGHRWGDWTPYLMLGLSKPNMRTETRFSASTNALVNSYLRTAQGTQESQAIGVRYDLNQSMTLKVQAERIHRRANETGAFTPSPVPPRVPTESNNTSVFSVSLQGVF